MKAKAWSKVNWGLLFTAVILFMAYVVIQYVLVNPHSAGIVHAKLQLPNFPAKPWMTALYAHILAGSTAFVIGPFQFLRKPAGKAARLHRRLGYLYVAAILTGSLSGAYLSYYATGGRAAGAGFLMLDICWMTTTTIAMMKISRKKFIEHRQWMLRSYAVTFAFVTFRLLLLPLQLVAHLPTTTAFRDAAWLCLIVNLCVAERIIRRKGASI